VLARSRPLRSARIGRRQNADLASESGLALRWLRLEHADDWLAGRGRDQPNEKPKDQTGRLHQVKALYRTGEDGAAEVLTVQLSGHGLDGGPDSFVHPDVILSSAEDAVRLL